jgi:serine-type D-Ala-D-Ala carboxypeptidase (penicillin-binding protein 5/6)
VRRAAARGAFALLPLLLLAVQAGAIGSVVPQVAPPPTPVPPNGSPSPFLSRLTTPADPQRVPKIDAPTAILADLGLGQVLLQKAPRRVLPIASLTKLMTALLVLEGEGGDLDRIVVVDPDAVFGRRDYGAGSTLGLRPGERISVRGLLAGLLLGSANDAAEALAIERSGSVSAFVRDMDARAKKLGMTQTHFASPHGLDDGGYSSAADLLTLLRATLRFRTFRELVARPFVTIVSASGPRRRIQNRNVMLWLYRGATGVKTGFTTGAGFCLITTARRGGRELAAIALGGRDEVFSDAAALLNHGFAAYELRTLIEAGEPLGSMRVRGGDVPVVAGQEFAALVRVTEVDRIERTLSAFPRAAYPPPSGSVVGSLRVRLPGATLGRVPVLAADLPAPAEPSGSWWGRAAGAVAKAVTAAIDGLFG